MWERPAFTLGSSTTFFLAWGFSSSEASDSEELEDCGSKTKCRQPLKHQQQRYCKPECHETAEQCEFFTSSLDSSVELSSGLAKKRDITKLELKGMHRNSGERAANHTEIGNTQESTAHTKRSRQDKSNE